MRFSLLAINALNFYVQTTLQNAIDCLNCIYENGSSVKYPESLRLVGFHDKEQDVDFTSLTNAMHLSSLEFANLYKL